MSGVGSEMDIFVTMSLCSIKFCGGAETVTGSCILLECGDKKVLVDCGMFQGLKALRLLNRREFPFNPAEIDEVILTHAHLDHCGRLPLLVKGGFAGPIHATQPTIELASIILKDSAKIQEEEAERANREGYSKHNPATALYTLADVEQTTPLFHSVDYQSAVIIGDEFKFKFHNAGHILGAAIVEVEAYGKTIIFSGDLGRFDSHVLYPPKKFKHADVLILESTYGSKNHPDVDPLDDLARVINETHDEGGTLIIPSFAVERAQELIYFISRLKREKRIPSIPAYLDSPMGVDATKVFYNYPHLHRLDTDDLAYMQDSVTLIKDYYKSQELLHRKHPKIILAGSGMLTGGRVLHYLERHISNPQDTILLAGYQAEGTRGRDLATGKKEIKFFGLKHKVKARVEALQGLSAHIDARGTLDWLSGLNKRPAQVFLNHGEPAALKELKGLLFDQLKIEAEIASPEVSYKLSI